jgi:hypothetical protein
MIKQALEIMKLFLCLLKHHATEACGGQEMYLITGVRGIRATGQNQQYLTYK